MKTKYKLMRLIPRNEIDAKDKLWEEKHGAIIDKQVELTEEELTDIVNTYESYDEEHCITDNPTAKKLRKVLE